MTGILGTLIEADSDVITFGRALFAVLALSPLLSRENKALKATSAVSDRTSHNWRYLASGFLLSIHWVSFFVSVKTAGVAIATLGFSSFAAFITVLEWIIDRNGVCKSDWVRAFAVSVGLILITPSFELANRGTYGFAMGLLSGFSFAAMAVFNSRMLATVNPIRVARNQNIVVAFLMAFWAIPLLGELSGASWLWLAVLGIFCTGLSHSLFVSSLKRMRVSTAGLVIALEPLYAIVAAWLLFHEIPSMRTIAGGIIIVGAIMGVSYSNATKQQA